MKRKTVLAVAGLAAIGLADVAVLNVAEAFNLNKMMNPSRWFGSDSDRYYDRGYYGGRYGPYGYGGPYGWGGYGPGWGGYGPGWGGYGPGWGGYGPYGGYGYVGQPSTIVVNPSTGSTSKSAPPPPPPRMPEYQPELGSA